MFCRQAQGTPGSVGAERQDRAGQTARTLAQDVAGAEQGGLAYTLRASLDGLKPGPASRESLTLPPKP